MYFVKIYKHQVELFNIFGSYITHCAVQPFDGFILCHTVGRKKTAMFV